MRPAGLPGAPLLRGGRGKVLRATRRRAWRGSRGARPWRRRPARPPRRGSETPVDGLGDAGEALGHDVVATVGLALGRVDVALEGAAVAADEALDARAGQLGLALAAALEATDVLLDLALAALERLLRARHGAVLVDDAGGDADDAVTGLEDAADVDERGALGDVATLLGRDLRGLRVGAGGLARLVLARGCGCPWRPGATATWRRSSAWSSAAARVLVRAAVLAGGVDLRAVVLRAVLLRAVDLVAVLVLGGGAGGLGHVM